MFCSKCGFEFSNDAKFCPKCGAPVAQPQAQSPAAGAPVQVDFKNIAANFKDMGNKQLFALINVAALFFSFLFSQIDNIKATVSFYGYSSSGTGSMFEDAGFIRFLFILFYLAAIGIMVLPLFLKTTVKISNSLVLNNDWGLLNYIVAIAVPALAIIWYVIKLIDYKGDMGSYGSISPSFVGWLFILFTAAAIGVAVKGLLDFKKSK